MTKLKKAKGPYETMSTIFDKGHRNVIVSIEPNCVVVRAKRSRDEYRLPWATVYVMAVRAAADASKRSKAS